MYYVGIVLVIVDVDVFVLVFLETFSKILIFWSKKIWSSKS